LGYVFPEVEDTIFYNHRPRKSYPHGFDFSTKANEITYTGATVTFSMLQLAFYMGFEEIYMIGVDASYTIPKDAHQASSYSVGVIDMKSDDINHFHPDYFGKGFRWHDPQVSKMLDAYREARKIVDQTNQRIYNATVGGQLEVFERRDYSALFSPKRAILPEDYPRLLILDMTAIGDFSATGEIKQNLLANWPLNRLMQIAYHAPSDIALTRGRVKGLPNIVIIEPSEGYALIEAFQPDVIIYRPLPGTTELHDFSIRVIERFNRPLVTWIMDDWPRHLEVSNPVEYNNTRGDFEKLIRISETRLSICNAMSEEMHRRYGKPFRSLANGVLPNDWSNPRQHMPGRLMIRYIGGLEQNMNLASVVRIARVVEAIGKMGHDICFEINTKPWCYWCNLKKFSGFQYTIISANQYSEEEYREKLMSADVSLIAYNFDALSQSYVKYSMANKMPECLASGSVLFAHGPKGIATIDYLSEIYGPVVVSEDSDKAVEMALIKLMKDHSLRAQLAQKSRAIAFGNHNLNNIREHLRKTLSQTALAGNNEKMASEKLKQKVLHKSTVIPFCKEGNAINNRPKGNDKQENIPKDQVKSTMRHSELECRGKVVSALHNELLSLSDNFWSDKKYISIQKINKLKKLIIYSDETSIDRFLFDAFNGSDLSMSKIYSDAKSGDIAAKALKQFLDDNNHRFTPYKKIKTDDFRKLREQLLLDPVNFVFNDPSVDIYPYFSPTGSYGYEMSWVRNILNDSMKKLNDFKKSMRSDIAVLIGNGPSLRKIDFSRLKNQDCYISNYAIKNKELACCANGVAVTNYLVAEQEPYWFNLASCWKFYPFWLTNILNDGSKTILLNASGGEPYFSTDILRKVSWHSTVSHFWLQILYSAGYKKVVLIGFDNSYKQEAKHKEGDMIYQSIDDENHFDPKYFKGKKWQAADTDKMAEMYTMAKRYFEENGREIVNCSVGGKLEVFRRGKFEDEIRKPVLLNNT